MDKTDTPSISPSKVGPVITTPTETSRQDIVEREADYNSCVVMRDLVTIKPKYSFFPKLNSVPEELKQDFSRILEKPIFLTSGTWTTSGGPFTPLLQLAFPSCLDSNVQLRAAFELSARYRLYGCFIIQVSGTPQHSGIVIASVHPRGSVDVISRNSINTLLQAPHAFMAANESTPVCLEVPWYSQTKLRSHFTTGDYFSVAESDLGDVSELNLVVLNQLAAPTGGSTSLTYTIHVKFHLADFYVPANRNMNWIAQASLVGPSLSSIITPVIDGATNIAKRRTADFIDKWRNVFKGLTGLHNPNSSLIDTRMIKTTRNFTNTVDIQTFNEKLHPYSSHDYVTDEPIFYTDIDEMSVASILQKPQFLTSVPITTATTLNSVIFSRPITPLMETYDSATSYSTTPLQSFAYMSRFWRGDLELVIQSSMSNFQYFKVLVVLNYANDPSALSRVPSLVDTVAMQTHAIEFSGGNQVQTIRLPYCSTQEELPILPDVPSNVLSHGVVYVYLIQPIVNNGSGISAANLNFYVRTCENFNLYGYATERLNYIAQSASSPPSKFESGLFTAQATIIKPSDTSKLLNPTSIQISKPHQRKHVPILSVRDYMRRYQMGAVFSPPTSSSSIGVYRISVNDALDIGGQIAYPVNPFQVIRSLYYGMTGGLKFKVIGTGVTNFVVRYVPPNAYISPTATSTLFSWNKASISPTDPLILATNVSTYGPSIPASYPRGPLPTLETSSDLAVRSGTIAAPSSSTSHTDLYRQQVEFQIPFMNTSEFVGAYDLDLRVVGQTPSYFSSYGDFVITYEVFNPETSAGVSLPSTYQPTFTFMYSFADESRLGFQVFSNPIAPVRSMEGVYAGTYYGPTGAPTRLSSITAKGAYIGLT